MPRGWTIAATATALAATAAYAQVEPSDEAVLGIASKAARAGHYLDAADRLRPLALTPDGKVRNDLAWSLWAEAEGVLTGEPPADPKENAPSPEAAADLARIAGATPRDAIAEIVKRAKRTRIVILNENHGVPRSRAFALEVARALRPLGYDVLAAETFDNVPDDARRDTQMKALAADGYVRRSTGYYTRDPVYAYFVRQALALGYRPIAYEATNRDPPKDVAARIVQRETMQADYLMRRAVTAYPRSKILVFVGYSHVAEAPLQNYGQPLAWMAARLKAASGIDPLTIDQTMFLRPSARPDDPVAAAIARATTRSIILHDRRGPVAIGQYAGAVDLQVIHPRLRPVAGRPGWLAQGRRAIAVPHELLPATGRRLIQAFPLGSADDAVPIDQLIVTAGMRPPPLMVDGGQVRFAFQDADADRP